MDEKTAIDIVKQVSNFVIYFHGMAGAVPALDLAIAALQKQVPMKPVSYKEYEPDDENGCCPVCGRCLPNGFYCSYCGQMMKEKNDGDN